MTGPLQLSIVKASGYRAQSRMVRHRLKGLLVQGGVRALLFVQRVAGVLRRRLGAWLETAEDERTPLDQLEPAFLLPLTLNRDLGNAMSLAVAHSEKPFSGTDIRLLRSVVQ